MSRTALALFAALHLTYYAAPARATPESWEERFSTQNPPPAFVEPIFPFSTVSTKSWDLFFRSSLGHGTLVQWGLDWEGKTPYTKNDTKLMAPASVMKLITATAALKVLGPDFVFENQFSADLNPNNGDLTHPEFVVSGDPTWGDLSHYEPYMQRFEKIVAELKARNVQRVVGPIKVTSSRPRLLTLQRPTGWKASWMHETYASMLTPFIFNGNAGSFTIGYNSAKKAKYIKWITPGITTPVKKIKASYCTSKDCDSVYGEVTLDGLGRTVSYDSLLGYYYKNPKDPGRYSELPVYESEKWLTNLFEIALKAAGIQHVETSDTLSLYTDKVVVELNSKPLREILGPFLRNSINIVGDRLFYEIADRFPPNSLSPFAKDDSQGIKNILFLLTSEYDLIQEIKVVDGSGLSIPNRIQPRLLYKMLSAIRNEPYFRDFLAALPVSGSSGTLANRMAYPETLKRVYAKTGTVDGVANLAGFFNPEKNNDPKTLDVTQLEPFVILTESGLEGSTVRLYEDLILKRFAKDQKPTPAVVKKPSAAPKKPTVVIKK